MIDLNILTYIDPDDYDDWFKVGAALKHEGHPVSDWDDWSRRSTKYKSGECQRKWNTFNEMNAGAPVTGGTIIQMAKERGYVPPAWSSESFGWDDEVEEIGRDYRVVEAGFVKPEVVPQAQKGYKPIEDLREYLSEMFEPDEFVGYCDKLEYNEERESWEPKAGIKTRTAGSILEALKKGFNNASIKSSSEAGAMIRFNPLDGAGESDSNVTAYRYALVESDVDTIEKQYALIKAMNLPVKFLIHSGNKSLHAIVHIDAESLNQYRDRVNFLYAFCKKNGLTPDEQDKNASRYSRMPGIKRGGTYQRIVDRNIGAANYKEWREWADAANDNLPEDLALGDILANLPPLKDELISGVLRVGHKLLLSGPSKAGKSFMLMSLAIAIASGTEWLGHKCKQGKVFYINLELDGESFANRFEEIYRRSGIDKQYANNVRIWNLRGRAVPMDKLTPFVINRTKNKGYAAVIVDPIYKVITGDENNATEMSQFCSYFDRIAMESQVAMIYCHHHSKGAGSKYSNAVDRASGSGVFARDPDAILDLTQLRLDGEDEKYRKQVPDASDSLSAWEMSGTLREFAPMKESRLWFDFPYHRLDEWNFLADVKYSDSGSKGVGKNQTAKEDMVERMNEVFDGRTFDEREAIKRETVLDELGISDSNLKKHTTPSSAFEPATLDNGIRVIFRRGIDEIIYKGATYKRPKNRNQAWSKIS